MGWTVVGFGCCREDRYGLVYYVVFPFCTINKHVNFGSFSPFLLYPFLDFIPFTLSKQKATLQSLGYRVPSVLISI